MRNRLLMFAGLGLALFSVVAPADNGPVTARSLLESFTDGLETLHAPFRQTIINPDGSVLETGEGEAWIQRPNRFSWSYHGEFPELIIADGVSVWLYDQSLEQVTVKPQSGLLEDTPLMLLTDLSGLDEQFVVTELGRDGELHLLELAARDVEGEFERIILGLNERGLSLMVLEDAFGIRTEVHFTAIERNPTVPPGHFEFEPPPGVDVIGEPGEPDIEPETADA